jgi:hypothetical protein
MRSATLIALATLVAATPFAAQAKKKKYYPPPPPPVVYQYDYAIAFTCGSNPADLVRAVPGDYAIAVDIRNPSGAAALVDMQLQLTFPPGGMMPAYPSEEITQTIYPNAPIQVSCAELMGDTFFFQYPPAPLPYRQGLLLLSSLTPLQVFATRTAAGLAGGISMQTEPIPPSPVVYQPEPVGSKITICHRPPGNPGNAHTISVGVAAWPAHQAHGDTEGACVAP